MSGFGVYRSTLPLPSYGEYGAPGLYSPTGPEVYGLPPPVVNRYQPYTRFYQHGTGPVSNGGSYVRASGNGQIAPPSFIDNYPQTNFAAMGIPRQIFGEPGSVFLHGHPYPTDCIVNHYPTVPTLPSTRPPVAAGALPGDPYVFATTSRL